MRRAKRLGLDYPRLSTNYPQEAIHSPSHQDSTSRHMRRPTNEPPMVPDGIPSAYLRPSWNHSGSYSTPPRARYESLTIDAQRNSVKQLHHR
ncbi:hypothetical protein RB213_012752 [Colletotrichum asianum]